MKIIGIPFDEHSSYMRGTALAPDAIRKCLHNGASNYTAENGIDIMADATVSDLGNLDVNTYEDIFVQLQKQIRKAEPALFLGGDHSITFMMVQLMHRLYGSFDILHFDAH